MINKKKKKKKKKKNTTNCCYLFLIVINHIERLAYAVKVYDQACETFVGVGTVASISPQFTKKSSSGYQYPTCSANSTFRMVHSSSIMSTKLLFIFQNKIDLF